MKRLDRRQFLVAGTIAALGVGLAACTPEGDWVVIRSDAIEALRKRLKGTVLIAGDRGFTDAWMPTNGRYRDTVPLLVARVADERDVVECVRWAREHGIQAVPRGGGHSYAGLSTTTGLIVDLSQLNEVRVDTAAARITTGGAATNRDIFAACENGPLILPGGTCLSVAIGGLTLGGGIGYHTRWAGLTADHLTATRMVTADGEIVDADEQHNGDLFWASRGGAGGNFGIHTRFEFDLVPVPAADIVYYRFQWRGADAALAMLSTVDALEQTAPPEFVASGMAQATTPRDGEGPRDAVDVTLRGQFLGSLEDFHTLVAPVLEAATPVSRQIVSQPFWQTAKIFTTEESANHSWGDLSRYTDKALPSSAFEKVVDLVVDAPSRSETDNASVWMLGWVGGDVVDRFGRTDTAYVHRGVRNLLRPTPVWSNMSPSSVSADLLDWTDEVIAVLEPHTPRESYQNFPNRRIKDWQQQYYAENFERLVGVKKAWDPDNVFRNAQSIPVQA